MNPKNYFLGVLVNGIKELLFYKKRTSVIDDFEEACRPVTFIALQQRKRVTKPFTIANSC